MFKSFTVTVPGTTSNLGPGFDCIGAAFSIYNTLRFSPTADRKNPLMITIIGSEADKLVPDEHNLVYQAFAKFYNHIGQSPPPVQIEIELGVPVARGLGSSATAIVGGLVGANSVAGNPLSLSEITLLAISMEGHPDNVVPALLGGCQLSASKDTGGWEICQILWHETIIPIIAIPDFELSTAEARRILPVNYSRSDLIFNTAHLGLLLRGLESGREDWLRSAMKDKVHQPYRKTLIRGFDAVRKAAMNAGAYELTISGAGPTLLALTNADRALSVAQAIAETWKTFEISAIVKPLRLDTTGTLIEERS
jgi:homoserine kinase